MSSRFLILLLFCFSVVFSEEINEKVKIAVPKLGLVGGVTQLSGEFFNSCTGDYKLPLTRCRILLPLGVDESSIEVAVSGESSQKLPGVHNVDTIGLEYDGNGALDPVVSNRDGVVYSKHIGRYRQFKFVELMLSHVEFDKSSGKLSFIPSIDISVSFNTEKSRGSSELSPRNLNKLTGMVDNSAALSTYGEPSRRAVGPHFAVITTKQTVSGLSQLNNFLASKNARGFKTTVYTEEVWGGGSGNTSADNLHAWLKENYLTEQIDYIMIIGDPTPSNGDIAMKMVDTRSRSKPGGTDFYFSDVTGNWDISGNGIFGEPRKDMATWKPGGIDAVPDMVVGRIPLYNKNYSSVDAILEKTMKYERAKGSDIGWRKNMLLAMDGYVNREGAYVGEAIHEDLSSSNWGMYRIYGKNLGGCDESSINEQAVTDAWTSGTYGVVSWLTHGKADAAQHIMNTTYAKRLTDDHPAFVTMGSCLNGKPSVSGNLGYTILKKGAVGVVCGSETTIYTYSTTGPTNVSPTSSYLHGFIRSFTTKLSRDKLYIGDALTDTKEQADMGSWRNYCNLNLYGDPTLGIDVKETPTSISKQGVVSASKAVTVNQVGNKLTVSGLSSSANITLYSISGRAISSWSGAEVKSGKISVSLGSVAKGSYIIQVKNSEVNFSKKVVFGI